MKTVFVYDDGQVGLRDLPPEFVQNYSYREAIRKPLKVSWSADSADAFHSPRYVEWLRRSQMYDGRPIFVAPRFAVKEVVQSTFVTRGEIERGAVGLTQHLRDCVRAFIKRNASEAIPLDEQFRFDLPVEPGMKAQQIEHWGLQALFAVPGV